MKGQQSVLQRDSSSLTACPKLNCFIQLIANLAEQGIGGIKPEARDETRGLPLSDSRYPKGATIAGDETKIRFAFLLLDFSRLLHMAWHKHAIPHLCIDMMACLCGHRKVSICLAFTTVYKTFGIVSHVATETLHILARTA